MRTTAIRIQYKNLEVYCNTKQYWTSKSVILDGQSTVVVKDFLRQQQYQNSIKINLAVYRNIIT